MDEKTAYLALRDDHIEALRRSLSSAEHGLGAVPSFIKIVVRECGWRDRVIRQTGQRASFSSFVDLVTAPPLEGLGASLDQLRGLCRDDPEALDAIDRASQNPRGGRRVNGNNVPNEERPEGNSAAKALRRLRKDRPDLHARVLAKELTAHAAMIEAGFRQQTVTVTATVEGFARSIRRQGFSDRQLAELARLIGEHIEGWPP